MLLRHPAPGQLCFTENDSPHRDNKTQRNREAVGGVSRDRGAEGVRMKMIERET